LPGKRGRPIGYSPSPESRARTSAGVRRNWAERRPWLEISNSILAAVADGDVDRASAIYHEHVDSVNAELEIKMTSALTSFSQQDFHDIAQETIRRAAEVDAETHELLFVKQVQKMLMEYAPKAHVTDAEVAIAQKVLLNLVKDVGPNETRHDPMTGSHKHRHANDGKISDTEYHTHRHSHNNDNMHNPHRGSE
jgi:hypothetical protein